MERSKARAYIFPAITLQILALWPTAAGELSGSDPWAGPFWTEPVLRTRAFHLRTDWSDRTESDLILSRPNTKFKGYLLLYINLPVDNLRKYIRSSIAIPIVVSLIRYHSAYRFEYIYGSFLFLKMLHLRGIPLTLLKIWIETFICCSKTVRPFKEYLISVFSFQ